MPTICNTTSPRWPRRCPGSRCGPTSRPTSAPRSPRQQAAAGHRTFTCATPREMVGMAAGRARRRPAAGQRGGRPGRLAAMAAITDARVTVAVDSRGDHRGRRRTPASREVLIDVNVGLPRCGCDPDDAGRLADRRPQPRASRCAASWATRATSWRSSTAPSALRRSRSRMATLLRGARGRRRRRHLGRRHRHLRPQHVGHRDPGRLLRADGHRLRASSASRSARPSRCWRRSSRCRAKWTVCDAGLKSLGMDHGDPIDRRRQGVVLLRRAHHVRPGSRRPARRLRVGDRVRVMPAHVDPTMALHERVHLTRGDEVVDTWADRPPRLVTSAQLRRPARPEGRGRGGDRRASRRGHLGERAAVALVGDEDRVVAEARVAASRSAMRPSTTPSATTSRPSGQRDDRDRAEAGRAVEPGHASQRRRAAWPRCRRRWRRSPAYRAATHAGRAVERVDLEAGVVGHRRLARSPTATATRLQPGVALERVRASRPRRARPAAGAASSNAGRPTIAAISAALSGLAVAQDEPHAVTAQGRARRRSASSSACSVEDLADPALGQAEQLVELAAA